MRKEIQPTFLSPGDIKSTESNDTKPTLIRSEEVYEKMYTSLCAYHFGTIGLLELLDAFEEILHVQPTQPNPRSDAA